MPKDKLRVNDKPHELDAEADMPLLWALQDMLGLTGTKYSYGIARAADVAGVRSVPLANEGFSV